MRSPRNAPLGAVKINFRPMSRSQLDRSYKGQKHEPHAEQSGWHYECANRFLDGSIKDG
jgi:hypothetical protein